MGYNVISRDPLLLNLSNIFNAPKPKPLHGLYAVTLNGKKCVVEYEPDTALRDSEQIPMRTLEEIRANILALEQETGAPLGQIMENV